MHTQKEFVKILKKNWGEYNDLYVQRDTLLLPKANSKYMKDYDKNKESPYIDYQDGNKLYG